MYYTTYKKERRMSAVERLIALVEQEVIANKKKAKNKKEGREDENYIK